jgi:predicted Fe-S protein YdhL (DUF1289 family)
MAKNRDKRRRNMDLSFFDYVLLAVAVVCTLVDYSFCKGVRKTWREKEEAEQELAKEKESGVEIIQKTKERIEEKKNTLADEDKRLSAAEAKVNELRRLNKQEV